MDKFDIQISQLKPASRPLHLDRGQFIETIKQAQRARQMRRVLRALLALGIITVVATAMRRNIFELIGLTFRYFGELPSMLSQFIKAYQSTVTWSSLAALLLVILAGILLMRSRKDVTGSQSQRTYRYAALMGVLALGFGLVGLLSAPHHAAALDELKRGLNARGHLEVHVNDKDYELYAKSNATDNSIRSQAAIETLRTFDISAIYPELKNLSHEGFVVEVRAVNTKDDCIFYVERRLEPALNTVQDANSGCIRSNTDYKTYYVSSQLKATKAPKWKVGQAFYLSFASNVNGDVAAGGNIVFLLDGKADQYIARNNSQKIVPKGQPSQTHDCGIDFADVCPDTGGIDIFTNAQGHMATGEIGSSIPGDSFKPRQGSHMARMFGTLIAMDDHMLQLRTDAGQQLTIKWPRNIIEQFNTERASRFTMSDGPLKVQVGDHLNIDIFYARGMDLNKLSIGDVQYIGLALKSFLPDPRNGDQPYNKEKAIREEKY